MAGEDGELGSDPAESTGTCEETLSLRRWSPTLVSFEVTRDPAFRFVPGQYTRVGLTDAKGQVVWRPLSVVSAPDAERLEFFVVLIQGGAFSQALDRLKVGDPAMVDRSSYGFLTRDQLAPGEQLWMLATGTGLGPFVSMLRDPATWDDYSLLIVAHSVRYAADLAYREEINALAAEPRFAGRRAKLRYLPIVTREPGGTLLSARIPQLILEGRLEEHAGVVLSVERSRLLICGNPELTRDMRQLLGVRGFATTRRGVLGQMAFEKYW